MADIEEARKQFQRIDTDGDGFITAAEFKTALAQGGDWQPVFRERVEGVLRRILPPEGQEPARLHQAMRYSALGDGKRIRPLLVYAAGAATGVAPDARDARGAAVVVIHA